MARNLVARQKKILRDWIKNTKPSQFIIASEALNINDENGLYWRIYNINPHENFDSNVERFVADNAEPIDYFGGRW